MRILTDTSAVSDVEYVQLAQSDVRRNLVHRTMHLVPTVAGQCLMKLSQAKLLQVVGCHGEVAVYDFRDGTVGLPETLLGATLQHASLDALKVLKGIHGIGAKLQVLGFPETQTEMRLWL